MSAALPVAAIAMSAIAPVVEGIGANAEARAAARADEENGRLSRLSGEYDVAAIMREERDAAGEAIALGGGALLQTGSFADVIAESARQRDRDIAIRRKQAEYEDRNYRQAADDKRAAGRNAIIAGVFSGAANAVAGANANRNAGKVAAQQTRETRIRLGGYGNG